MLLLLSRDNEHNLCYLLNAQDIPSFINTTLIIDVLIVCLYFDEKSMRNIVQSSARS